MTQDQEQASQQALMLADRKELSTRLYTDEGGTRVLTIPPELSERFNVLAPTASLVQADPMFSPGFTIVQLDPTKDAGDFYPLQGKQALAKNGLRKLAVAGGVEFDGDKSKGGFVGDAHDIEIADKHYPVQVYTYHAVGHVRKSDGTMQELTGDHTWHPVQAVADIRNPRNGTIPEANVLKQFLQSWKFVAPMSKAKAQNMIMRDALTTKQKYEGNEASKPFFVVGYNLTLDHTDPNAMGIIGALIGADMSNLYGDAAPAALPEMADEDADMPPVGVDLETGEVLEPEDAGVAEVVEEAEESWMNELRSLQQFTIESEKSHFNGFTFADIIDHPNGGLKWFNDLIAWGKDLTGGPAFKQVQAARKFVELHKRNGGELI